MKKVCFTENEDFYLNVTRKFYEFNLITILKAENFDNFWKNLYFNLHINDN
jgi:hypothetical protein